MLSLRDLEVLEQSVSEELDAAISQGAKRKSRDHLALTGAEVGTFLAMQVVLPIVSSFVSGIIYDKYRSIQTKKELAAARAELLAELSTQATLTQAVGESQVIAEIENALASNGVKREQARAIATSAYERVSKLATPT